MWVHFVTQLQSIPLKLDIKNHFSMKMFEFYKGVVDVVEIKKNTTDIELDSSVSSKKIIKSFYKGISAFRCKSCGPKFRNAEAKHKQKVPN